MAAIDFYSSRQSLLTCNEIRGLSETILGTVSIPDEKWHSKLFSFYKFAFLSQFLKTPNQYNETLAF